MPNLNKVMLMGNLTRDPEVKYTPKGTAVCGLSLAINRSWNDDKGNKMEEVTFVEVELWGRTAEVAGEYLRKGRPVFVEGRLKLDTWEDKETGKQRSKIKVVGEHIEFIGAKLEASESSQDGGSDAVRGKVAESTEKAKQIASKPLWSKKKDPDPLDPFDDVPF